MTRGIYTKGLLSLGAVFLALLDPGPLRADVVRVVVDRRVDVLDGRSFGEAGSYEMLVGRIYFEFDPGDPANERILDLDLAPRNAAGRVEAWADFRAFQPQDPSLRRGVGLVEVSNRGRLASFQYLNLADDRIPDPRTAADFGDGWLMDLGLTIVVIGWQHDVPERGDVVGLHAPVATDAGEAITGLVRADWTLDEGQDFLRLGHYDHWSYPPIATGRAQDRLTVRETREGARTAVPRSAWGFISLPDEQEHTAIALDGGFEAGKIYELVYEARDPRVVGLGLAAVRDVVSYAKYDAEAEFPVDHGVAFGFSQTGRLLRHFLYEGFNTDEEGRRAYDGMLIQVAGAGRGSFNHRFAQASRDATPYTSLFYPTDLFPFTSEIRTDPITGTRDGLFAHTAEGHLPLVFQTNTGYEYWGRASSLIHTSADGRRDVPLHPNERIYLFSGAQHMTTWLQPSEANRIAGTPAYSGNPVDFRLPFRALTLRMVEWVQNGVEPPPSEYPRLDEGTLVPPDELSFPRIPDLKVPTVAHVAYRTDFGPRFATEGVITKEPPQVGPAFPSLVPEVDETGNAVAGLRSYELRVPLATYTPWLLREAPWNQDDGTDQVEALANYRGTYIPLPRSEEERRSSGDPRPSVEALYGSRAQFVKQVREAAAELVEERFLLPRDVELVEERASAHWDWLMR